MKNRRHIIIRWLAFAAITCSLVPFGLHWYNARLTFSLAQELGVYNFSFIRSLAGGVFACFLIIMFSAWRAKIRFSVPAILGIGAVAFGCGFVAIFASAAIGRPQYEYFLDGFAEHVTATGVESNAVAWAEQVFTNQSLNPMNHEQIDLPQKQVPSFFTPVFGYGKIGSPWATIYYAKNGKEPESVEIRVEAGMGGRIEWGILIFKDLDPKLSLPPMYEGRPCGKRLFVYYGGG